MRIWRSLITTCLALFISPGGLLAEIESDQVASRIKLVSGIQQTTLIELYTSQGCSSCPPAEHYLNSLKQHPQLWKTYIPIALHVDYWDYIGWKDQFALAENTRRQRQYAKVNQQRTIYTPAFFVNGKPWRRTFYDREPDSLQNKVGNFQIILEGNKLSAKFSPVEKLASRLKGTLVLNVAIVGMGYQSRIEAGEREGSQTSHDFILLARNTQRSDNLHWQTQLPDIDSKGANRLALVAWLSRPDDPRPIQALGGYLN
jgi:hypothetical protein